MLRLLNDSLADDIAPSDGLKRVCLLAVKVLLVPDGHVMTLSFPIGLCILDLKHKLAAELRVPAKVLRISMDGTRNLHFTPASPE